VSVLIDTYVNQILEGPARVKRKTAIVIGAGVGGLVSAIELAAQGIDVTVVERAAGPGGKMREVDIDGVRLDAGPTVLTMRWIFDEIFAAAGASLNDYVTLRPAELLARHHWSAGERLDLFADIDRSADAIGIFSGAGEARRYRQFCDRAQRVYQSLDRSFLRSERPTPQSLTQNVGLAGLGGLLSGAPFSTLWRELGRHFHDPRLRQLFGRYSTYCGSSPFAAPAMLMLIAHVEQRGVWLVEGGMHRIAVALAQLATLRGAVFRYNAEATEIAVKGDHVAGVTLATGERLAADTIVANADAAAIAGGLFGKAAAGAVPGTLPGERSLSAVTWAMRGRAGAFPLVRHNVFFSDDYKREFDDIRDRQSLPSKPTVYVCAQDRQDIDAAAPAGPERLFCLVNAPATGDSHLFGASEIEQCETRTFAMLEHCGLKIEPLPRASLVTTPNDFHRLYPGTGGALYGRASHGWQASFRRPGSRTRIGGLYLAGGSTHPGAGIPMAALSGRLAAASILADSTSTGSSRPTAIAGGISMRSAKMGAMV
jgi:1-hydroxycarotenoid 3,4-desaturase